MPRTLQKYRFRVLFAALALILAACAGNPPVQEMSDARQAIQAAIAAGAERLAERELADANRYMNDAETSLQKRAYNSAKNAAREARRWAEVALNVAKSADEGGGG